MMTDLVNPGDINDPVDAEDLLRQLTDLNIDKLDNKLRYRTAEKLRIQRDVEIRNTYNSKAKRYYDSLWLRCRDSPVGHNFNNIHVKGYTIRVCSTCGCPTDHPNQNTNARDDYESDLINNLAKQLR